MKEGEPSCSFSNPQPSSGCDTSKCGCAHPSADASTRIELVTVIERYLKRSGFKKAALELRKSIDTQALVPRRTDFRGGEHAQSYARYLDEVGDVPCLLSLVSRLSDLNNVSVPPSVPNLPLRLLVPPRNAVHRTEESIRPPFVGNRMLGRRGMAVGTDRFPTHLLRTARELGCRVRVDQWLSSKRSTQFMKHYRVTGHTQPIYCVTIDRTGRFVFTGADDNIVKVWNVRTGHLRYTLRGHTGQIADMAISHCNRRLATGSVDKTVRVWCCQTGALLKVYNFHTAMVSSVKWLPYCEGTKRWLVSTSYDCCVNFYAWDTSTDTMCAEPFHTYERDLPGMRILTLTHSPGGQFVAVGDSHSRIRMFHIRDGLPEKGPELTAHTDRVDSLVWAHSGLRFASGSRDGHVRVWRYSSKKWRNTLLALKNPAQQVPASTSGMQTKNKYKVMMLCWSLRDDFIISSGSDFVLQVWDSTKGVHLRSMVGHTADCFVLHCHPFHPQYLFTAGHDGLLIMWNIDEGAVVRKWANAVDGQGNQALFDLSIAPDGTSLAVVDQFGQLSMYSLDDNKVSYKRLKVQFFGTDYEPLTTLEDGRVVDEGTGIEPHLLPPPLLTNGDLPYPDEIQSLVPGRDLFKDSPVLASAWLTRNVIEPLRCVEIEALEGTYKEIGAEEMSQFNKESERSDGEDDLVEEANNAHLATSARAELRRRQRDLADQRIREEVERLNNRENERERDHGEDGESVDGDFSTAGVSSDEGESDESEEETSDSDFSVGSSRERRRQREREAELAAHHEEVFSTARRRRARPLNGERRTDAESDREGETRRRVDGTRRTRRRARLESSGMEDDAMENSGEENEQAAQEPWSSRGTRRRVRPKPAVVDAEANAVVSAFPDWMSSIVPRRFPYVAQLGDHVVYFTQGHCMYLEAVKTRGIYHIMPNMIPRDDLDAEEFCVVDEVTYLREPIRMAQVKLTRVDKCTGARSEVSWFVKYHDLSDVPDFLVLRHQYDKSISCGFDAGDSIESILDEKWWTGTISSREPANEDFPRSNWFCLKVKWDSGEDDTLSPWDVQPKTGNRRSEILATDDEIRAFAAYDLDAGDWPSQGAESTRQEDMTAACQRLSAAIHTLSALPDVEPFASPVDLNFYPDYPRSVNYPSDLDTIAQRLHNGYYRRLRAVQQDVRLIALNAQHYNVRGSPIVRNAKVLVETLIRFTNNTQLDDVMVCYNEVDELPDDQLRSYRKERAPKKVSTHSLERDTSASNLPGWALECIHQMRTLLSERCAQHFVTKTRPTDDMRPVWEQCEEVPDLTEIVRRIDVREYKHPQEIIDAVEEMLGAVRNAVDSRRSAVYRDHLDLGRLSKQRLSPIVEQYERSLLRVTHETGIKQSRLRRRATRTHAHEYNTRQRGSEHVRTRRRWSQSSVGVTSEFDESLGAPSTSRTLRSTNHRHENGRQTELVSNTVTSNGTSTHSERSERSRETRGTNGVCEQRETRTRKRTRAEESDEAGPSTSALSPIDDHRRIGRRRATTQVRSTRQKTVEDDDNGYDKELGGSEEEPESSEQDEWQDSDAENKCERRSRGKQLRNGASRNKKENGAEPSHHHYTRRSAGSGCSSVASHPSPPRRPIRRNVVKSGRYAEVNSGDEDEYRETLVSTRSKNKRPRRYD